MQVERIELGERAYGVAVDETGAVWCSLHEAGALVRVDGNERHVVRLGEHSRPMVLAAGADGNVWCACGDGTLARLAPNGDASAVPLPAGGSPYGVAVAPDGTAWYTKTDADVIGRVAPDGAVTELAVPGGAMPAAVAVTSDGTAVVALNRRSELATVRAATVATVRLPTDAAGPVGVAALGATVWFTEIDAGQVGRYRDGAVVELALPDRASRPHAVAPLPGRGCWVTLWAASAAVRVDDAGHVTAEVQFDAGDEPHGIAVDRNGTVWVALESGALARLTP